MFSNGPASWFGSPEPLAADRAVAERGDESWLGHRFVCAEQWADHACSYLAGDEQDVGVAW